ncbi:MAG TPA: LDL receptor domain-containing protein [Polyangiaceae bacterium]|nr:LDL receptor domain-containing protein [Polyangiaceae bacterium]
MLGRAVWCWCLVPALASNACGKVSSPHDDFVDRSGSAGATLTAGSTSESAGSASVAGNASTAGTSSGGSGGSGGDSDAGGAGPDEILAALDTDDATINRLAGRELLELGLKVGYAEGYAQCTCLPLPSWHLDAKGLDGCARAESGFEKLFDPTGLRCILEESRRVPDLEEAVRCRIRQLRARGRAYQQCPDGPGGPNRPAELVPSCGSDEAIMVLNGNTCFGAILCADGTFQFTGRCDYHLDCADGHDERGCHDVVCGDKLVDWGQICDPEVCPVTSTPFCPPDDPRSFLCDDGTQVPVSAVCNDVDDCATGRDEQYCYR